MTNTNIFKDHYASDDLITWYTTINYNMMQPLKWQIPILKILNYAVAGRISRIMISAPPQHGKTVLICDAFTSWYMVNNPNDQVILTAYSHQRATRYGEKIRDIINYFGKQSRFKPELKQDNKSKTNFKFASPFQGELLAQGSHGAIMGHPANLVVIDDPIKELSDARSPTMQEKLNDWYLGSIDTRLRKRSSGKPPIIIVVAQRLHQRDLQGIILEQEPHIDGKEAIKQLDNGQIIPADTWAYMNFPALSKGADLDILSRPLNTPLWSEHKNYHDLVIDRKRKGSYRFEMIMQGNPTREEDYIFRHEWFYNDDSYSYDALNCIIKHYKELDLLPKIRFWDLAGTTNKPGKNNDYYCGALVSKDEEKDIMYIHNIKHDKKQALGVFNVIKETIIDDGLEVKTIFEQEPGSQSAIFLNELQNSFYQYNIEAIRPVESKLYRSYELKRLAENGALKFVIDPTLTDAENYKWIETVIRELENFDGLESNGAKNKHDDIVDSLSAAANHFKLNSGNNVLFGFINL